MDNKFNGKCYDDHDTLRHPTILCAYKKVYKTITIKY